MSTAKYLRERRVRIKIKVLAHYSPNGNLGCSWPGCSVTDIDMLTLDHVNNDGKLDRVNQKAAGSNRYAELIRGGYPDGFQTLCWNHQWKKELLRQRESINEK